MQKRMNMKVKVITIINNYDDDDDDEEEEEDAKNKSNKL